MVTNLSAMQETWVQSLGWEDPLEEGRAAHSRILAWRIPMDRGAWWTAVHGVQRVGHSTQTEFEIFPVSSGKLLKVLEQVNNME